MPAALDAEEARVLGCLMEKEVATPEYYPLTLNSLRNACNQSSSRLPVVSYDDGTVSQALATLREKGFIRIVYSPSNRAAKYRHILEEKLMLDPAGRAVMCLLLLRGPQTVGELRTRSDRLHSFGALEEVESVLSELSRREEPLVARLDRGPGQKEARYRQLLGEEASPIGPAAATAPIPDHDPRPDHDDSRPADRQPGDARSVGSLSPHAPGQSDLSRQVADLGAQVVDLRAEVDELRSALTDLRRALGSA
jgi:uncharacterized protein